MNLLNSMAKTFFIPVTLLLLLSGCGNTYTFNNKTYMTPEEALTAHQEFLVKIENELIPFETTVAERAAIITPSKSTCEALGITRKGQPAQDLIDYLGDYLEEDYQFFSRFLVKSNLFASVDNLVEDHPIQAAKNAIDKYDVVIYLDLRSPTQQSWMLISPPSDKPQQINFDNLAKVGAPKIQSWIDDVKRNIEGSK